MGEFAGAKKDMTTINIDILSIVVGTIMLGFSTAIGNAIAQIWIVPHLKKFHMKTNHILKVKKGG